MKFPRAALVLVLLMIFLSACLASTVTVETPTSMPTSTQTSLPTPTIVWFPPTATFTPFPTRQVTATPDMRPGLGEIILTDDFSSADQWSLSQSEQGSVALSKGELTIAISEPKAYLYSVRQQPLLSDFYAEITTSPSLCQGLDEYGMLFRINSPGNFYRFSLSCNGQERLDRVTGGESYPLQSWTVSGDVPPGAPSISRLGVWAVGKELHFFVNDQYQFSIQDPMHTSGTLGIFARSAGGDNIVTINFSDLVIREVNP